MLKPQGSGASCPVEGLPAGGRVYAGRRAQPHSDGPAGGPPSGESSAAALPHPRVGCPEPVGSLVRGGRTGSPGVGQTDSSRRISYSYWAIAACSTLADENLASPVMFAPFEQFWIATDTYARLSKGTGDDDVLMVNSTTLFLLNLAIRTPCRSLLDLGTGCGVVAIVVARAVRRTRDRHRSHQSRGRSLPGSTPGSMESPNIEVLTGDLFQPVAGRRFERILSNPPFYITPSSRRMFAENPMELDGFCRNLGQAGSRLISKRVDFFRCSASGRRSKANPGKSAWPNGSQGTGCDAIVCRGRDATIRFDMPRPACR